MPLARHFTCFFSCYGWHLKYIVQNPDSHHIEWHYDKGKWRDHYSIGCEHENFLLAFSGSWGHVRNFVCVVTYHKKTYIFHLATCYSGLALLPTLSLPTRVSAITGVDCIITLEFITKIWNEKLRQLESLNNNEDIKYLQIQFFLSTSSFIPVGHSHLTPDGPNKHKSLQPPLFLWQGLTPNKKLRTFFNQEFLNA